MVTLLFFLQSLTVIMKRSSIARWCHFTMCRKTANTMLLVIRRSVLFVNIWTKTAMEAIQLVTVHIEIIVKKRINPFINKWKLMSACCL